jgi:hypothetical protein
MGSNTALTDEHYWTVIVQEWRGQKGLRHANGLATERVLRKIGCKYYRLTGLNCARATVPATLVEAARRQDGFACIAELDQRRFTVFIEP